MPLRMLVFVVLYLAAVVVGRATRLDGTQLALVWPAAGVAFIWLADGWRRPQTTAHRLRAAVPRDGRRQLADRRAPVAVAGVRRGEPRADLRVRARSSSGCAPDGWALRRSEDVRALLVGAVAGACASAAIGPVAVLLLTDDHWPATPAAWVLRNATGTIVVAGVGLRVWDVARHRSPRAYRGWEFLGVTVFAGGAYMLAFGLTTGVPLAFLVVPLSVWVALRYHTTLAALHGLFIGTMLIALTIAGRGPFAYQTPQVRVMLAQAFIGVVSMLTLVLALHRDERVALEHELAAGARRGARGLAR